MLLAMCTQGRGGGTTIETAKLARRWGLSSSSNCLRDRCRIRSPRCQTTILLLRGSSSSCHAVKAAPRKQQDVASDGWADQHLRRTRSVSSTGELLSNRRKDYSASGLSSGLTGDPVVGPEPGPGCVESPRRGCEDIKRQEGY